MVCRPPWVRQSLPSVAIAGALTHIDAACLAIGGTDSLEQRCLCWEPDCTAATKGTAREPEAADRKSPAGRLWDCA